MLDFLVFTNIVSFVALIFATFSVWSLWRLFLCLDNFVKGLIESQRDLIHHVNQQMEEAIELKNKLDARAKDKLEK